MTYDTNPPAITPTYTGFVNGDTASALTTPATCSTTATNTSTPSTYADTCSGASDPNYTILYVSGNTTVNPAPISVAVGGSQAWGGSPGLHGRGAGSGVVAVGYDRGGHQRGQVRPSRSFDVHLADARRRELHPGANLVHRGDVEWCRRG